MLPFALWPHPLSEASLTPGHRQRGEVTTHKTLSRASDPELAHVFASPARNQCNHHLQCNPEPGPRRQTAFPPFPGHGVPAGCTLYVRALCISCTANVRLINRSCSAIPSPQTCKHLHQATPASRVTWAVPVTVTVTVPGRSHGIVIHIIALARALARALEAPSESPADAPPKSPSYMQPRDLPGAPSRRQPCQHS